MHAVRALRATPARVGVVTLAGDEPPIREALRDMAEATAFLHVERAEHSIGFGHAETAAGRRLVFERSAGPLACPPLAVRASAVLYAPVADELDASLGGRLYRGARRGAILQGWLRRPVPGKPVEPLRLDALPLELVGMLASLDLLVASGEDLAAVAPTPVAQIAALRDHIGSRPLLVVTDSVAGAWLDLTRGDAGGTERWHLPVGRIVVDVNSVGAGDAFAAALIAGWPEALTRAAVTKAAQRSMALVASMLAGRAAADRKGSS